MTMIMLIIVVVVVMKGGVSKLSTAHKAPPLGFNLRLLDVSIPVRQTPHRPFKHGFLSPYEPHPPRVQRKRKGVEAQTMGFIYPLPEQGAQFM